MTPGYVRTYGTDESAIRHVGSGFQRRLSRLDSGQRPVVYIVWNSFEASLDHAGNACSAAVHELVSQIGTQPRETFADISQQRKRRIHRVHSGAVGIRRHDMTHADQPARGIGDIGFRCVYWPV